MKMDRWIVEETGKKDMKQKGLDNKTKFIPLSIASTEGVSIRIAKLVQIELKWWWD